MKKLKVFLVSWILLSLMGGISACANSASRNAKNTISQPAKPDSSALDQHISTEQQADFERRSPMEQEVARFETTQRALQEFSGSQNKTRHRLLEEAANYRYGDTSSSTNIESHILIFGGRNRRVFLGCVTCGKHENVSINNSSGHYGSSVARDSIFNQVGDYGSRVSDYSICNPRAQQPPVVVDEQGNFYGYLNINLKQYPVAFPQLAALTQSICR